MGRVHVVAELLQAGDESLRVAAAVGVMDPDELPPGGATGVLGRGHDESGGWCRQLGRTGNGREVVDVHVDPASLR